MIGPLSGGCNLPMRAEANPAGCSHPTKPLDRGACCAHRILPRPRRIYPGPRPDVRGKRGAAHGQFLLRGMAMRISPRPSATPGFTVNPLRIARSPPHPRSLPESIWVELHSVAGQ